MNNYIEKARFSLIVTSSYISIFIIHKYHTSYGLTVTVVLFSSTRRKYFWLRRLSLNIIWKISKSIKGGSKLKYEKHNMTRAVGIDKLGLYL